MMAVRRIHFRDRRPPQEIQFALERELMTLLQPSVDGTQLMIAGASTAQGVPFRVSLRLEAAHFFTNCYQLAFEADHAHLTPAPVKGGRKPLDGWVDLWTREFKPINAPEPGEGSADRARQLAQEALSAESHLTTVEAVQAEILGALRRGASFSTAHKEGGSIIKYQQGHFVRSDYGESDEREVFHNDADLLAYLRRLYDWETSRPIYPQKVPEYVAWKLMLRLLRR